MKAKTIKIIRVDPTAKIITAMNFRAAGPGPTIRELKRIVRAKTEVGSRELLDVETAEGSCKLIVAGPQLVEDSVDAWRLKGGVDTAGVAVLFGASILGGMLDCPVDVAWVEKRIVWVPGEDFQAMQIRATDAIVSFDPMISAALLRAEDAGPFEGEDSSYFLQPDDKHLAPACIALGLTDEPSQGRNLTRFGGMAREALKAALEKAA
jgi:hypothetical protein